MASRGGLSAANGRSRKRKQLIESDQESTETESTTIPATEPIKGTPAVPSRYPNLETATQIGRTISKPRQLRRNASNQEDCLRVLTKTFGKPSFRGRQKEIMEAALNGADVLVVAPTGMGKRYALSLST
jgi:superfamily II DNA helicase RecQ